MGMGSGVLAGIPVLGNPVPIDQPWSAPDTASKKILADVALNEARSKGATYTDVRIGRYLNQFIITRENKVENVVNTESFGIGIRVIANGSWGFAATDKLDNDSIANAAALAATGGVKVIAQSELTPEKLSTILRGSMTMPEKLAKMAAAAKQAGKPDAANLLADMVEAIAGGRSIQQFKGAGA